MKAKRIIYIAMAVLFVAYLFSASTVMVRLFFDGTPMRATGRENFSISSMCNSYRVRPYILGTGTDIFDSFFLDNIPINAINGDWEYIVDDVYVLLIGDSGWYYAPIDDFAWEQVRTGNFSAVHMSRGNFDLYFYVVDGTTAEFVRTELRYVRDSHGIHIRGSSSIQVSNFTALPQTSDEIWGFMEAVIAEGNVLTVSGWLAMEGLPTVFSNYYVKLTNTEGEVITFDTQIRSRLDVAEHLDSSLYLWSGFSAEIPLQYLDEWNTFAVSIVIDNDGELFVWEDSREHNLRELHGE